jgi:hypothetical protein
MTKFNETTEAIAFISTADGRETSREIMEAIAFFARNEDEAELIWNGDFGDICTPADIWEKVTKNGRHDAEKFCWGADGSNWWNVLRGA